MASHGRRAGILLALLAMPAGAVQVEHLQVVRDGDRYGIQVEARLNAGAHAIWQRLIDFPGYPDITPAIESCERIGAAPEGGDLVLTRARACVIGFCKEVTQLQRVQQLGFGELLAEIDPAGSDFRYGLAHWWLTPGEGTTGLRFEAELEPKFWVPPLLGPWLIARALKSEARASVANLERLAQESPVP